MRIHEPIHLNLHHPFPSLHTTPKPKPTPTPTNPNSTRKPLKRFTLAGAAQLDKPLLWIWRELFVSLLSTRTQQNAVEGGKGREEEMVLRMLGDIEGAWGWRALERVWYGGRKGEGFFLACSCL
jgi:hypothetical protein